MRFYRITLSKDFTMKLYISFLTVFFAGLFLSCTIEAPQPVVQQLPSVVEPAPKEEKKVDRDCSSRDSCEDICDDIFDSTSERFQCYAMTYKDVNVLAEVADILLDERIRLNDLEDIDSDDLEMFLEIGSKTLVKIAEGEEVGDSDRHWGTPRDGDEGENSKEILQWIAENDDIAEAMTGNEDMIDFGIALLVSIYSLSSPPMHFLPIMVHTDPCKESDDDCIRIAKNSTNLEIGVDGTAKIFLRDLDFGRDSSDLEAWRAFIQLQRIDGSATFIGHAIDEESESAVEYAHSLLVKICENMTDEDSDDVEVKQCLQASYCQHDVENGNSWADPNGIFEDLEDDYDLDVDRKDCNNLDDEKNIDKSFG